MKTVGFRRLCLFLFCGFLSGSVLGDTILLRAGSTWKYRNTATAPDGTWKNVSFNDSEWRSGPAELGYGDGDEATVTEGAALSPKPVSAYFRAKFVVGETIPAKLKLRLKRDDGAVVYLNGEQALRSNMPDGTILSTTLASATISQGAEETFHEFFVPGSLVQAGTNTVAVEVHQVSTESSDISFDLEITGVDETVPTRPVVSIVATQALTSEPLPLALIAPGRFLLRRTGETNLPMDVWIAVSGSATAGADYTALVSPVRFEAGKSEAALSVIAHSDNLVEGDETVVVELASPTNGVAQTYSIDQERRRAVVVIADEDRPAPATVVIERPDEGQTFSQGTPIRIEAVAVDPRGYIGRLEFLDGERVIGISEIVFVQAPTNGTPIHHSLVWSNAAAGDHVLRARAMVSGQAVVSAPVRISVIGAERPTVSIVATRAETTEPSGFTRVEPGLFTVRRTGPTNEALTVFVEFGGTAAKGIDYLILSNVVRFAAGQREVKLEVVALEDNLVEGDETVVAELYLPPTANPLPDPYEVDAAANRAVVTIRDANRSFARIDLIKPENGQGFPVGSNIVIQARAVDPAGAITRVDFYDGTNHIGFSEVIFITPPAPGTTILHEFTWENAPLGEHVLRAAGVAANGVTIVSLPVRVEVGPGTPELPVVSVRFMEDLTLQPVPNADYAPGSFEFRRTGPTNEALTVFYRVPEVSVPEIRLATPGVDYVRLSGSVTIPAGRASVNVRVEAIDDSLVEGPEVVAITLTGAPTGTTYRIDSTHAAASLTILDNDQGQQVVLGVKVSDEVASEPGVLTVVDDGVFLIQRVGGPANVKVIAQYQVSGTASNGVDYTRLTGTVELGMNVMQREVRVHALMDNLVEGEETVTLTLVSTPCPAIVPPPADCYVVGSAASGRVVIRDSVINENRAPVAKLVKPANGAVFTVGTTIETIAEASDADGTIARLEILDGGAVLGSGGTNRLVIRWENADLGKHELRARAVDNLGKTGLSEVVTILVREPNAGAFVFRNLPDAYTPGTSFRVELKTEPPTGSRAHGVEDRPPQGWAVSEISHEGVFDATTGKVKFGPFTDGTARTLTYRVTPPLNASGRKEFVGAGSVDGASYPIGGDQSIGQSASQHPADVNVDWKIVLNELTAYAGAWKAGASWSNGPVPIPLSFVTRAGFIWKRGEAYRFNGTQAPPLCWEPVNVIAPADGAGMLSAFGSDGESMRLGGNTVRPGASAQLQLNINPPTGTSAYGVEETVPRGWIVTEISHEGTHDPETGIIRWGLFMDGAARGLRYKITPPANVTEVARLRGKLSYDGKVRDLHGGERMISVDGSKLPRLEKVEKDRDGVRVHVGGESGQVGVLQRSRDLIRWDDVSTLFLPNGTLEFLDDGVGLEAYQYYRLQVR